MPLPETGEPKRAILDTYTKEHSAEYQSQALIDLARRLGPKIGDLSKVESIVIHTSHHTHYVIGTGANDPQKMDPKASRETLDHSIMYIFAVALEDGGWHHERSYAPERAGREQTIALWHKISTVEDPEWTRRYHSHDPQRKGVWRPSRRKAEGRLGHQRRTGAGRCASAGRPPLHAAGLHPEIPDVGGRRDCRGGTGSLHRGGRKAGRAEGRRTERTHLHGRSKAARQHSSHGIFDWRHAAPVAVQRAAGQR